MEFFEPPLLPQRTAEPPPRRPSIIAGPWQGPPANVLAGVAPLRFVLARTNSLALTVTSVRVYRTGLAFTLTLLRHGEGAFDHRRFHYMHQPLNRDGTVRPEFLRLGLAFSDGRKATNLHATMQERLAMRKEGEPPPEAVLRPCGGQGSGGEYTFEYWAWPLPPAGPLGFVCEWPSEGVPLTRHDVDGATILAASTNARTLWGDTDQLYGISGARFYVRGQTRVAEADESPGDAPS